MPRRTPRTAPAPRPGIGPLPQTLSTIPAQTIFCGDNAKQLPRLPAESVDLIYVDPPFNSNRNYEVFWGERQESLAFEDRHESTCTFLESVTKTCAIG